MAGFGFSPTDVVNAIRLACYICDTYFDKQNSPDSQYTLFGAEIRTFRDLLTKFNQIFGGAARAYQEQPRLVLSDDPPLLNPQHDILENERKSVIGNTEKTLEECEAILAKCTTRHGSRLLASFTWNVSTKKKVAALRDRLHFHMIKIQLLIGLYNGGLRRDDTEQLTRVEEIVGELHAVQFQGIRSQHTQPLATTPEVVRRRFMTALATGAPDNSQGEQELPLEEGFDALTYHLSQSTIQTRGFPGPTQSVEQYINLLKARWLSELLKASPRYESSFYYKRLILKLDHAILREFSRHDLTVYEEHELASAPATAFTIWKPVTLEPISVSFSINEQEVTLLELVLTSTQQTLIVNRISDTELRLIKSSVTRTNGEIVREREEHIPINIHAHHFEPAYASPFLRETVPRVVISGSLVHSANVYDLDNMKNVLDLQQAFTGFRVVSDMENVE
ncbi:hypothetical protein H2198_000581 [Neophaeococcomyces mojaviensis]|uniref:Uncharacterized protein n=1 Tax=Neophaeococcomyces mojaviensis TaxID=3383035 RepID=A0ACC3AJS4_9EURO|nr:hypothetical protein H2198_000581 [Knufia sp. JES_112]